MWTETITERTALAAGIPPQTLNNGRLSSDGVDMAKSARAFFVLSIGTVTSTGNMSAWLQESSDNFVADIPSNDAASPFGNSGAANVSLTGLTTSNKEYTFEVREDQLTTGKRYVRLQVKETVGNNVLVCVVAHGDDGRQKPNKANNATAVATQNVVA